MNKSEADSSVNFYILYAPEIAGPLEDLLTPFQPVTPPGVALFSLCL